MYFNYLKNSCVVRKIHPFRDENKEVIKYNQFKKLLLDNNIFSHVFLFFQ